MNLTELFAQAYPSIPDATFLIQRAGIDVLQLNTNRPPARFWADATAFADATGLLPRLVEVALADKRIAAWHTRLRSTWEAHQEAQRREIHDASSAKPGDSVSSLRDALDVTIRALNGIIALQSAGAIFDHGLSELDANAFGASLASARSDMEYMARRIRAAIQKDGR